MKSRNEILSFIGRNKNLLKDQFHVKRIGLFGSFAREEQKEGSDLDLLIEFEDNTQNLFELKLQIKNYFKNNLGVEVDICREKYIKPQYKSSIIKEAIYVD
jgi:uncharacterized protein